MASGHVSRWARIEFIRMVGGEDECERAGIRFSQGARSWRMYGSPAAIMRARELGLAKADAEGWGYQVVDLRVEPGFKALRDPGILEQMHDERYEREKGEARRRILG